MAGSITIGSPDQLPGARVKNKVRILHFFPAISAIIVLIQLSGIFSHAQFTKTKILLSLLVLAGCAWWIIFNKLYVKISKKKGTRAFLFQLFLLLATLSIAVKISGQRRNSVYTRSDHTTGDTFSDFFRH